MPWYRVEDCNRENIERLGGRLHQKVNGRYITILLHNDRLFCIDSCCFHASGPVGEGPVKDIEDVPTIRCMWHNMIFALDTGERVTQEVLLPGENEGKEHNPVSMSFPLRPQGTTGKITRSGEPVQRVHNVREVDYSDKGIEPERWPVEVELEEHYKHEMRSDIVACNPQYAKMCMTIQQRKIDSPAASQSADANGSGSGGGEIKNSFARTLLHTLQTSATTSNSNSRNSSSGSHFNNNDGSGTPPPSALVGRRPSAGPTLDSSSYEGNNNSNNSGREVRSNLLEEFGGSSSSSSQNNINKNDTPRRQSRIDPEMMALFDNAAREKNASMNLSSDDVLKMNEDSGEGLRDNSSANNSNNCFSNNDAIFDEEVDLASPPRVGATTPARKNSPGSSAGSPNFETAISETTLSGSGVSRENSGSSGNSSSQYYMPNNSSSSNGQGGESSNVTTNSSTPVSTGGLQFQQQQEQQASPDNDGPPPPPPGNPRAPTPPPPDRN